MKFTLVFLAIALLTLTAAHDVRNPLNELHVRHTLISSLYFRCPTARAHTVVMAAKNN